MTGVNFMFKKVKKQSGFTLIEVVVALGIFSIATTYAIGIFVQSNQVQRRTANVQRVLSDARYVLEVMAREVRMGEIDYDYSGYATTGGELDLEQSVLALRDVDNQPIRFRRQLIAGLPDRYVVQVCSEKEVCLADDWLDITPEDLSIERLVFYISPPKDPFTWNDSLVDYNYDSQPMVTIVMQSQSLYQEADLAERTADLQTTVTTRKYVR